MRTVRSIEFRLKWESVARKPSSMLACFSVWIDGDPIWPLRGDETAEVECFADDLLAHLTECWKPLLLRQTYPIAIELERPFLLWSEAERRWANLPTAQIEEEEPRVESFEDIHNFTSAFSGVFDLPPLWLFRAGEKMQVDTGVRLFEAPFDAVVKALGALGDQIAVRLASFSERKWDQLVSDWKRRDEGKGAALIAWSIGVPLQTAELLVERNLLSQPRSVSEAANDDEIRVAARMAGSLRPSELIGVLELVRKAEALEVPRLNALANSASYQIAGPGVQAGYPYEQGVAVAKWLRKELGLKLSAPADPIQFFNDCGVPWGYVDLKAAILDAVAVWGRSHGPAVFLNMASSRFSDIFNAQNTSSYARDPNNSGAVRVTLAHEICHLLLDRDHSFSAVDVLNGRMPIRVEQRARAFAAEFLLPSEAAVEEWKNHGSPIDADAVTDVVERLCSQFRVTRNVATWKLQHGLDPGSAEYLSPVLSGLRAMSRRPF